MAALRGAISDRPWGATFARAAEFAERATLTITDDGGRRYEIGYERGAIVSASSPLPADSIARVALLSHLVTSSQVPALIAQLTKAIDSGVDEFAAFAQISQLPAAQLEALRHRLILQRAARTFAIEHGTFELDASERATDHAVRISVGAAILVGARQHLTDQRLTDELRALAPVLRLASDPARVAAFELTADDQRVIAMLHAGTTLPAVEAALRDVDPRAAHALIYALAAAGVLARDPSAPRVTLSPPVRAASPSQLTTPPPATPPTNAPQVARTTTGPRNGSPTALPVTARTATPTAPPVIARTVSGPRAVSASTPPATRPTGATVLPRAITPTRPPTSPQLWPDASQAVVATRTRTLRELEALITSRAAMIERGVDHFTLLGVSMDANDAAIAAAQRNLAELLSTEHLTKVGLVDDTGVSANVALAVERAARVLLDPGARTAYVAALRRGGDLPSPSLVRDDDDRAAARDAVRRGESALRSDNIPRAIAELELALRLAPNEVDTQALLAWARFCAAENKAQVAEATRKALDRAIQKSEKPEIGRFYLGRVERMLGREREALHHFQVVVDLVPNHREAASEIRVLEARLSAADRR